MYILFKRYITTPDSFEILYPTFQNLALLPYPDISFSAQLQAKDETDLT